MLEKFLIFVVFLSPLIFFHELGHFFFARLFGVRVEVFSIGFGPKILKYVRKGTEYAISAIPLGGYVKMFGDDPFSEVQLSEEERKVAFNHKSKWARFWIAFGGPLANLLLAYFLYVGLLAGGEKVPETKLGLVPEQSALFKAGLRTGDVLTGINDERITSFDDLNIKGSSVERVIVRRKDTTLTLDVGMRLESFLNEFVGVVPAVKKPVFVNGKREAFYATLVSRPKELNSSLEELNDAFEGSVYLYRYTNKSGVEQLDERSETSLSTTRKDQTLTEFLRGLDFYPKDLVVRNIVMGSPSDKAGIKKDDILVALNGNRLSSFEDLRTALQGLKDGEEIELQVLGKEGVSSKRLVPEAKDVNGKKVRLVGIESAVEYLQPKLIEVKAGSIGAAVTEAVGRTWDGIIKTFSGYKKLITREVSLNNIGGPLAIGKVASDSFNISLSMFFRLMAIISINLGVINLFPIPVLDGGHIVFLVLELVNGGPLSRRKLEIAQRFGISVLFFLIFVALFNDISRLF